MNLFGGAIQITGVTFMLFVVFAVIFVGYLLGRFEIKGVSLGTVGVFIAALLAGAVFGDDLRGNLTFHGDDITSTAFTILESSGLLMFIGSVGLIAGTSFFRNLKRNFKSYMLIGILFTVLGSIATIGCYFVGLATIDVPAAVTAAGITKSQYMISMAVGIMTGSLTSTPAFSASQATAATLVSPDAADILQDVITTGHAISYIFGVVGVIIFVQVVPKLLKVDMAKERELITIVDTGQDEIRGRDPASKKYFQIDSFGFGSFGLVVVIGIIVGMIKIPLSTHGLSGTTFSLTTTGGVLISGLVFSHFGHVGPFAINSDPRVLKVLREFGLVFFLIGTGIPGGYSFVQYFQPAFFLYGMIITIVPVIFGFLIARKIIKLPLLNALGSTTGGMTSTPALGALIKTCESDDVASAYAATYPFALVSVVLASQFLILIFG